MTTLNDHYAIAPSSLQKRVQTDKRVLTEIYSPWYLSCLYFSSAAATYRLIFWCTLHRIASSIWSQIVVECDSSRCCSCILNSTWTCVFSTYSLGNVIKFSFPFFVAIHTNYEAKFTVIQLKWWPWSRTAGSLKDLEAICTVLCISTSKEIWIHFRMKVGNNVGCFSGLKRFIMMMVIWWRKGWWWRWWWR